MADATPLYRIHGATGDWEVVIGLEVHAQISSQAKLFSGASTAFGSEPNANVSLIDAAMPGMLPVPNRECVRQAVRTGLALDAAINPWSQFDRKNYFYADLPQGYQISQLYHPIVGEGALPIETDDGVAHVVGIERIHIEQDAGKLMHDQHPTRSYVDLNRSGVALMEIVSRPDMRSPAEAGAYVRELRELLRWIGSCDGNMEQGSMRADVNVSVRRVGGDKDAPLGTRTETKNVNSVRFVMQAIELEAARQVDLIEGGGTVVQETRLFDPDRGETRSMRSKEDAHDYRYFPDPDLLPLVLEAAFIEDCRESVGELPRARRRRYRETMELSDYQATVVTRDRRWSEYFETTLALTAAQIDRPVPELAKAVANLIINELFGFLRARGVDEGEAGDASTVVSPDQAAKLLRLRLDGTLSGALYKEVFEAIAGTPDDPERVVEERGLRQTSDTGAIDAAIAAILAANADKVADYRAGKDKLFGFFVGQTMKAMAGKANPAVVNDLLRKALG